MISLVARGTRGGRMSRRLVQTALSGKEPGDQESQRDIIARDTAEKGAGKYAAFSLPPCSDFI